MRRLALIIGLISIGFIVNSQDFNSFKSTDSLALHIPKTETISSEKLGNYIYTNFPTDAKRVRAIYVWVANNIKYDFEKLEAIKDNQKFKQTLMKDRIANTLRSHKGVCQDYSELFYDLCTSSKIKSELIFGYTKNDNTISKISHVWIAAYIDDAWVIFDPTWGAGFSNDDKFVKQFSNSYYMINPNELIKTHMPFDPVFEFLNYPISNADFKSGKTNNDQNKIYFNYKDTIAKSEKLNEYDKTIASLNRAERNGVNNSLIKNWIEDSRSKIESEKFNIVINLFNEAVLEENKYIITKNKHFKNLSDDEIKKSFKDVDDKFNSSKILFADIKPATKEMKKNITIFSDNIHKLTTDLDRERNFLNTYLQTPKENRAKLFYK